jgi:aryl-alcohol dehydrogenase-like predicted oxidoreductase
MAESKIPRRHFREDVYLSVIGFGGMVLVGMEQNDGSRIVADACGSGINYFDVSPFYGNGEAELKLGAAIEPFRGEVFLACKTLERDACGAREELERSLRRLRTDHFDLYQFHSVGKLEEVEAIFAPGGAAETFLQARREGKIRFVGFSSHSVTAALAMMDRFNFDSILFPVNFVCYAQGRFGPQVMQKAKQLGVARLGLKAMAHGPWGKNESRKYPKCWYRPIEDRSLALEALCFALSEELTSIIPPGDERLFRMAMELIPELTPLSLPQRNRLLAGTTGLKPLLRT